MSEATMLMGNHTASHPVRENAVGVYCNTLPPNLKFWKFDDNTHRVYSNWKMVEVYLAS